MSAHRQAGSQPREQLVATASAALDAGVTLFDTADAYGPGEEKGEAAQGENERLIVRSSTSSARATAPQSDRLAVGMSSADSAERRLTAEPIDGDGPTLSRQSADHRGRSANSSRAGPAGTDPSTRQVDDGVEPFVERTAVVWGVCTPPEMPTPLLEVPSQGQSRCGQGFS